MKTRPSNMNRNEIRDNIDNILPFICEWKKKYYPLFIFNFI